MKLFTQLALVSAIAASGSAFAMQSMDDAALSETTGQDGITIVIAPPTISAASAAGYTTADGRAIAALTQTNGLEIGAAVLHDKDGLKSAAATAGTSGGAIVIGDASQAGLGAVGVQMGIFGSGGIKVNIDASGDGAIAGPSAVGSAPVLNINVGLPTDLVLRTGDISVAGSARGTLLVGAAGATITNAATGGTTGTAIKILNSMDIALGGATMNIQLGNTPQGAMIVAGGSILTGLHISGLSLHDADASLGVYGGDLGVSVLTLKDAGGADLTLGAEISVVNDVSGFLSGGLLPASQGGLIIQTTGTVGQDIMMQNVTLGSSGSTLGDLELINVQSVGTQIAIMGH